MSAFQKWLKRETRGDVKEAAAILYQMVFRSSSDSVVWSLLKRTGDERYTAETFEKAARIALEEEA